MTAPAFAGEYERVAVELCRVAQSRGKTRVAVLTFQSVGKGNSQAGGVVSEKLVNAVMGVGGLEVVERTLLASVLKELRLMHSGAMDIRSIKELGRILGVDALVAGTVVELKDGRYELNSRLIDTETARVLGVAVAKVDKDWAESSFDDFNMDSFATWGGFDQPARGRGGDAQDEEFLKKVDALLAGEAGKR